MAYDTRQKTSQRQGYDITGKMLRDYKNRNGKNRDESFIHIYSIANQIGGLHGTRQPILK